MSNSRTPHPPPSRFPPRPPRARPFELIAMQPPVRHHGYSNNFNYSHTSRPNVPRGNQHNSLSTTFYPVNVLSRLRPRNFNITK
ncbi:unnamed protein product [Rotaria socialis]|uniref:Uncharacterized protein n=1 Tax=Rotaria socialis TaxID=392032 RepID=A0A820RW53_9BILA|nr:unnamed protein product [Rotaria socialis]